MFVIPPSLDHSISAAAYSFALLKGGTPERILAGLVGTIWLWTHYLHPVSAAPDQCMRWAWMGRSSL